MVDGPRQLDSPRQRVLLPRADAEQPAAACLPVQVDCLEQREAINSGILGPDLILSEAENLRSKVDSLADPLVRAGFAKNTRRVNVGPVPIGGGAPVSIQSMLKCDPHNRRASLIQIHSLERAGCQIVRMAVPDRQAVETLAYLKGKTQLPLVADVHFRSELALAALAVGADKVRINPGNMPEAGVRQVFREARRSERAVRVGLNSGSLPRRHQAEDVPGRMLESVACVLKWAHEEDFEDLVFSLKASSEVDTGDACRRFRHLYDYPLHIGLTEAGPPPEGVVRSVLALQPLLTEGIGETLRISLTAPPALEVRTAKVLLEALGLRPSSCRIISCPTCGRTRRPLDPLLAAVGKVELKIDRPLTIAVMGCEVNGPGEASHADIGLTWGQGQVVLFRQGRVVRKVELAQLVSALREEIASLP